MEELLRLTKAQLNEFRDERDRLRELNRELADALAAMTKRNEALEALVNDVQEFIVAHAYDTTVGRKIDDFITERLAARNWDHPIDADQLTQRADRLEALEAFIKRVADCWPVLPPFDQYDGAALERLVGEARTLLGKDGQE